MSEQGETIKKSSQSPYWIGRHKRGFFGSLAVLGIAATGLFAVVDNNRAQDKADAGLKALRQDQACERVINDKSGPNANTATVRLGSLTTKQQIDCRVADILSTSNVGRGYGEPRLSAKVVDATVELPSHHDLNAAIEQDLSESQTKEWGDLPIDVAMGMGLVPVMALMLTALASGDVLVFSRRQDALAKAQANASA